MRKIRIYFSIILILFFVCPNEVRAVDSFPSVSVLSSENISTYQSGNTLNIYLNTFRPKIQIFFKVILNNTETASVTAPNTNLTIPPQGAYQFSINAATTLDQENVGKPIRTYKLHSSSDSIINVYPTPDNFPKVSFAGNTSLVKSREILSTPVVDNGTYAIASVGTKIRYFIYSPNNLIGFRKIDDTVAQGTPGGTPVYAYLEQKDFGVTATSPGSWMLLDANFNKVSRINQVKTKFGTFYPEGHGMTTSPRGNAVVIATVTRNVDSSWLQRQYKLPILDCDIAEVVDGKAIHEFSFWDWAVAHKSTYQPLFDAMPLFNDPQNPTSSPIDICHANSMEFNKSLGQYLISIRSPSSIILLDKDLKGVTTLLTSTNALQHFARFWSKTEITALGNYTFDKSSRFQDYKFVNGQWKLSEYEFPVHVAYCGNTNFLDKTHVWLGGGCGPFKPDVLGAVYQLSNGALNEIGSVKMQNFNYTYRADLL